MSRTTEPAESTPELGGEGCVDSPTEEEEEAHFHLKEEHGKCWVADVRLS